MGRFSPWKAACAWSFPVPLSGMAAVFLPVPGPRRRPPWPPEIRAQKEAPGGSTPLRSLSFFSPQRCYPELRRRGWAARHLIGLGPGLTPAGDDFLGGYLAGRFAQSPGGSRDSGVLFFSLSPSSLRRGNRHFAQAFHRKALAGNFSEYIADLARAVVIGGSSDEELQELAEKVSDSDPLWALTSCLSTVDFSIE